MNDPTMTNYNTLLKKYENPYVPGEQRSKEYNRKIKRKKRLQKRILIAKDLFNEITFHLNDLEKDMIIHLIKQYPNIRTLHGKASEETIILALIFYVKKQNDTSIRISNRKITRKYKLTHNVFETILCNLTKNYMKELYLIPTEPKNYNHNIAYKGKITD